MHAILDILKGYYDSNNFIPLDQDTTINDMVVIWL